MNSCIGSFFSVAMIKTLWPRQLTAERACVGLQLERDKSPLTGRHSSRNRKLRDHITIWKHEAERELSVSQGFKLSTPISSELHPPTQVCRLHNFFDQHHQLGTKGLNVGAHRGHFSFKPPNIYYKIDFLSCLSCHWMLPRSTQMLRPSPGELSVTLFPAYGNPLLIDGHDFCYSVSLGAIYSSEFPLLCS